jgi:hypothetical protein
VASTYNRLSLPASVPIDLLLVLVFVVAGWALLDHDERQMFQQIGRTAHDYGRRALQRVRPASVPVAPNLDL